MDQWLIPIVAGFLLSLIHIIGPKFEKFVHGMHVQITSLSAGLFLSYIFLESLETMFQAHVEMGKTVLLALFFGFISYHVLSKYLYQHVKNKSEREKELDELQFAGTVIDSIFTGFALAIILDMSRPLYFAIIPFALHTFSGTLAYEAHHRRFSTPFPFKLLSYFAPLLGAIIAQLLLIETGAFYLLLAFVTGAVLYIAVRHMLPRGGRGDLRYFLAGAAIGIALLFST